MEQKTASLSKTSIISGIYLGIASILISVIFYVTGNPFSKIATWIGYAVAVAGVVLAQLNFRKTLGGTMLYGQALGVGILTIVFASILSSIYTFVLYQFIDPSLQDQLRLFTEEQIVKQGKVPEDQIEMAVNMATKFQKPVFLLIFGILGSAFLGLIISLITSIFTKKKPEDNFSE